MSDACDDIELTIVAGGASRRMGHSKLHLRHLDGTSVVARWLASLDWRGPQLLVVSEGTEAPPELSHLRIAVDSVPGLGPLHGIETAMRHASREWQLFVPVDMPALGRAQLNCLIAERKNHAEAGGFMFRRQIDGEATVEPLPLLLHRRLLETIAERVKSGRRALHSLAETGEVMLIEASPDWPASVWDNLNHPRDLARFLGRSS